MLTTQTGSYPIGFREVCTWNVDIEVFIDWAQGHDLGVIDLVSDGPAKAAKLAAAGMRVGAIDIPNRNALLTADAGKRRAAVAETIEFIKACAETGPPVFFTMMIPDDPSLPPRENFDFMVSSYNELAATLEGCDGRIAVEGWPGPGCVCCTPEGFRAFFEKCPSDRFGINFDPSHLLRMGIDPLRFLREFAGRVFHVHGKDAELLSENVYEYGHEVPALFASAPAFGGHTWRYTIPGYGQTRWTAVLDILKERGYAGYVCIELEDARFNDKTGYSEQRALVLASRYLSGC